MVHLSKGLKKRVSLKDFFRITDCRDIEEPLREVKEVNSPGEEEESEHPPLTSCSQIASP
jgi:hypothetical protein